MLKLLSTLLATLLLCQTAFSQDIKSAPTTEEEYNYLTKGYKIQIESGLDMKNGYELEDMGEFDMGNNKFTFKALVRQSKNHVAAVLVIIYDKYYKRTNFLCIPHSNQELLEKYFLQINSMSSEMAKEYLKIISSLFSPILILSHELSEDPKK